MFLSARYSCHRDLRRLRNVNVMDVSVSTPSHSVRLVMFCGADYQEGVPESED